MLNRNFTKHLKCVCICDFKTYFFKIELLKIQLDIFKKS
jgi:hypothetical protein